MIGLPCKARETVECETPARFGNILDRDRHTDSNAHVCGLVCSLPVFISNVNGFERLLAK